MTFCPLRLDTGYLKENAFYVKRKTTNPSAYDLLSFVSLHWVFEIEGIV